jgi:Ca-activated chloride channel family protein
MNTLPSLRDVQFLWPLMLWLLALAPLLGWGYWRLDARQRAHSTQLQALASNTAAPGLAAQAPPAGRPRAWGRHVPAGLLWLALVLLLLAMARPQAMVVLPARADAIMLALDVSGSMRADDVKPDRLGAAQAAAKAFVAEQPSQVKVGLVTMAALAVVVQTPTTQREDLVAALDRVKLQNGSALGSGIVIALKALLPDTPLDVDMHISGRSSYYLTWEQRQAIADYKPVPPGSNPSAAIILLSDGESNTGADLMKAAQLAADRGVRVYTVGLGTKKGATLSADGWSMRVRLDEAALKKVAELTRGEYFQADNASQLKKIYAQLAARMTIGRGRVMEITALLVALACVLAGLGVGLSMLRFNRVL